MKKIIWIYKDWGGECIVNSIAEFKKHYGPKTEIISIKNLKSSPVNVYSIAECGVVQKHELKKANEEYYKWARSSFLPITEPIYGTESFKEAVLKVKNDKNGYYFCLPIWIQEIDINKTSLNEIISLLNENDEKITHHDITRLKEEIRRDRESIKRRKKEFKKRRRKLTLHKIMKKIKNGGTLCESENL